MSPPVDPPERVESPPRCYRHPDRETWVRCVRCERPICPECMRAAAVGFQCPDDARSDARATRSPRTLFGGRAQQGGRNHVTLTIIAINVVVFVIQQVEPSVTVRFANLGARLLVPQNELIGVATGEYYRLITTAFLHASVLHVAFNMFALFIVGSPLEAALGRVRFVALYVLAALGGSVLGYVVGDLSTISVGASGAVFGLFGAFYVVSRRLRADTRAITILLVLNLVITFAVPQIDWRAHLGGLATGVILAFAFAYAPRGPHRGLIQAAAAVAVAVALVGAVVVRTSEVGLT